MSGTLYLVATPIGNLEDITLRALRVLRDEVDAIACEDTRQTQKLLTHFEIRKPLVSYHEHNETARTAELLERLRAGERVALVSDAGTPLISDPGYRIVSAAAREGIAIVPLPGCSAVLGGLTASGLPSDSFYFVGFLPPKSAARRERLRSLKAVETTLVAYESPHRILETLADVEEVLGERPIALAREMTKLHEEFLRGTAGAIRAQLAERASVKGELTLVIGRGQAGSATSETMTDNPAQEVAELEDVGASRMEAIKAVAKRRGLPKREVYRAVEEQGSNPADKNRDSDRKAR